MKVIDVVVAMIIVGVIMVVCTLFIDADQGARMSDMGFTMMLTGAMSLAVANFRKDWK